MKRWSLVCLIVVLVGGFGYFYEGHLVKNFNKLSEMDDFPVPKDVKLEMENQRGKEFKWDKSSSENSIPLSYRYVIWKEGWHIVERFGETTTYEKSDRTILLQASTNYLYVSK